MNQHAATKASRLAERLYESMLRIRRVEEEIERVYSTDKVKSPVHLSIGQEAVSVGVCEALNAGDVVFGTYRGHAAYLAKGGDLRAMVAELYGKVTGCARGKAGSMHLVDIAKGMMGTSAVVATAIPQAVGYALAEKMRKSGKVVVCFFGDGAMEEGVFHESMNFAALKKLPVLFVCENNLYAIYTPLQARVPEANFCERAEAYKVRARKIESGDIYDIHRAASEAVHRIRAGQGPEFLEVMTCRWRDHVGPGEDHHLGYRAKDDVAAWVSRDSIARLSAELGAEGGRIAAQVEQDVKDAFEFAERSEFPPDSELYDHVFHK
ncbi:MAG: thiamine pyrophosphate-dependent dehydrogenase E1 component subunit alpha [Alphaproteobacteria bacterium]